MEAQNQLNERIILIDAQHANNVCQAIRNHYNLNESIALPQADLAQWLVCCSLDAGWQHKLATSTQVVLVAQKGQTHINQFLPGNLFDDIDGKAFADTILGEFQMSVITDESLIDGEPLYVQCLHTIATDGQKHSLVLVADTARYGAQLRQILSNAKHCTATILCMDHIPAQPQPAPHELMGYSLLRAMHFEN